MSAEKNEYGFLTALGRAIASGSSRAVVLTGSVQDLFFLDGEGGGTYVPLVDLLSRRLDVATLVPVIYELNGPIRFLHDKDREVFTAAWVRFQTGLDAGDLKIERFLNPSKKQAHGDIATEFVKSLEETAGNPRLALELLRWMCECSRAMVKGKPVFVDETGTRFQLAVVVEGADFLVPEGPLNAMSDAHLQRVTICRDWFSDLGFMEGGDTVILIAESRSLLNQRVAQMPQLAEVTVPSPDEAARLRFIQWFMARRSVEAKAMPTFWSTGEDLAKATAALSIQSLRQLLVAAAHDGRTLSMQDVMCQVEAFIKGQLGEDVVEFKRPEHSLDDVVGARTAKAFIEREVIPGLRLTTKDALASIIVCGAIGAGKTFLWEAVAARIGIPVLVLKNLRSKWFGETDVIFERLRRVLESLSKVLIYVNEADTAFGGVGADTHETERRLTGRIQAMMADARFRGKVHWLLDTARVHLLSADIRRPGRGGDLIFPVFDPEEEDRTDFIRWVVGSVLEGELDEQAIEKIDAATKGYSAGAFNSLRAELRRKADGKRLTIEEALAIVRDVIPPDIGLERRYQTLQALLNCTRRSLLPKEFRSEGKGWERQRAEWLREIAELEVAGIR